MARPGPAFEAHSEAYALFRRGRFFLERRHPGQAVLLLERALRLEPGRNSIREALGRALFAMGDHRHAAEQFGDIVADVPDNDYGHYALARCLLRLERPVEARAHLRLARALRPGSQLYREALDGWDAAGDAGRGGAGGETDADAGRGAAGEVGEDAGRGGAGEVGDEA